jgi:AcrR family transcriptional regulator
MSPRKYDMSRRAAAVEETRRRIVDATLELHAAQGIAATSWDEIAARAGVGVGTVYRHFPSLDELVPACGRVSRELLALPDPSDVPALFAGTEGPRARVERLVGEVFAIYERGGHVVHAALRERDVHPDVAEAAAGIQAALCALVDAAVEPLGVGTHERRLTRGMVDVGTWTALRGQGLEPGETVAAVTAMLACRLDRE